MNPLRQSPSGRPQILPAHGKSDDGRCGFKGVLAYFVLSCALVVCSSLLSLWSSASPQPAQSQKPAPSASSSKTLSDAEMARMSSDALTKYVFDHHGCNNCHTLGKGGKLGFTDRGTQVAKNFEGCIPLLTAMNVIAQVKETNRTAAEKEKAARFEQFGCTTCHQITPGKLGLTKYGTRLKSLHMACTDVERILSSQK